MTPWPALGARLWSWLAPHECAACARSLTDADAFCASCALELRARERTRDVDGIPAWSGTRYGGPMKEALHRFKFRDNPHLAPRLAHWLLEHVSVKPEWQAAVLVPVPMHPRRLAERGYNHAALLAGQLRPLGMRGHALRALRRLEDSRQQALLDRAARLSNLEGQFVARREMHGERVVLVDDVLTTGSTARACSAALHAAGARVVGVLTLAQAD